MADGLRCDVCEKFATHRNNEGWMSVQKYGTSSREFEGLFFFGGGGRSTPELHVCSWACLGMLAIQMPEAPDMEEVA